MTPVRGPLARLDRSRDELAKAWLVRLIERASLDEIRELPTDRIARDVPELIADIVRAMGETGGDPYALTEEQAERAASLAGIRGGRDAGAADLARDVAALQTVLVRALRAEIGESDPKAFADAVESLVDATGAIQAAASEALVKSRSRELESQANTDPLTGLGNLRALQRGIASLCDMQRRYGHPFAVLLLDIDGLKRVNDAHGHAAGDRVLMQVAMAVRRATRSVDTGARLGGDEFCVLAPAQTLKSAAVLAERMSASLGDEVVVGPDEPPVGSSIGVAACPEHGTDPEPLIEAADRAMYVAKASGGRVSLAVAAEPGPVAEEAKT